MLCGSFYHFKLNNIIILNCNNNLMSVLLETSLGDLVIDLYPKECPKAALNFLKLCKLKYYNNCLCYNVQKDYIVQMGDPTNTGTGGSSVWGVVSCKGDKRYFDDELS